MPTTSRSSRPAIGSPSAIRRGGGDAAGTAGGRPGPAGTDLELSSASGDMRLDGPVRRASGCTRQAADMVMGDAGKLDVTTASGDFSCGDIDGEATISSVSGDCTMHRVGGRLEATLTSGDLRVDVCDGDMMIASTSGDVRVGRCCGSEIAVRSISGDVRVGLPAGIRVEAEISTLSGRASFRTRCQRRTTRRSAPRAAATEDGLGRHPRRTHRLIEGPRLARRWSTGFRHGSCVCCRAILIVLPASAASLLQARRQATASRPADPRMSFTPERGVRPGHRTGCCRPASASADSS